MSTIDGVSHILPVGTLKIAALESCRALGAAVDQCLFVRGRSRATRLYFRFLPA